MIKPQERDLKKLGCTIQYIQGTKNLGLELEIDDSTRVYAYMGASYAVYSDMKSHTGSVISLGKGVMDGKSSTQN